MRKSKKYLYLIAFPQNFNYNINTNKKLSWYIQERTELEL